MLAAALVTALGGAGAVAQEPDSELAPGVPKANVADEPAVAERISQPLREAEGNVAAFVELKGKGAVEAFDERRGEGRSASAAAQAANQLKSEIRSLTDGVLGALRALDGATTLLARTSNAVPGMIVQADAAKLRELAGRSDVRSVRLVTPMERTNASADQLTKALQTWRQTGNYGDGIRMGIIDDGIDYTHAAFGGPGTSDAYEAIDPTKAEASYFPTKKVVGGTDLVGDDYDASDPDNATPKPDPNPLSCGSHGTHVAGTAGGFGVNGDGSTFEGDYAKLNADKLNKMRIGPGTAPKAQLYAIKVFGCGGSTSVTAQGMDWALDPDGDGDFSDRLDLINMSLGSDFGAPDDPNSLFVRKLAAHGVLTVNSAGNSGNVYDVGGSPGNTPEALTVASTRDSFVLRDAVAVTAPGDIRGNQVGQYSQDYADYDNLDETQPVVPLSDQEDGCAEYSEADAAAVKGKFVWLEWDDNDATRACGSAALAANAEAAGAAGAVLSSGLEHFAAGIAGNAAVPMFQLTGSSTKAVRPALEDGALEMRMAGKLRASEPRNYPDIVDTPSSFTSRGVRGPAVKPDVGAPGDTLASAESGSGNKALSMSGTSMASPHVAGIAALVRQANPDWTVEEVKAAVMNTATADLRSAAHDKGNIEAPQRVGAGRVDARAAVGNKVLAMVQDDPGSVSVSFGAVEAGEPVNLGKTIKLVNKGSNQVELDASYEAVTKLPGVRYELSTDSVSLSPKGTASVRVNLRIDDPSALRKIADPTIEKTQLDVARQFLADASGRVVFNPTDGSTNQLRVPVYSAPKPTAAIEAPDELKIPDGEQQAVLNLGGRGLDQGDGDAAYRSLISALQLGATSPELPECAEEDESECTINDTAKGGDLRYVGAATTAPLHKKQGKPQDAMLAIGLSTWEDWANVGSNTIPFVELDTTGDGKPDFRSEVAKPPETDVLVVNTVDLNQEGNPSVDLQPVNGQFGDVDTNVFDTNTLLLPINLAAIGIDAAKADSAPISYTVGVAGNYAASAAEDEVGVIDQLAEPVDFDPLKPGVWLQGSGEPALSYLAKPGTALVANYDREAAEQQGADQLLLLHHQNARGARAELADISAGAGAPEQQADEQAERPAEQSERPAEQAEEEPAEQPAGG
nr:S8 family serine peptidase [Tamaricihabitans halophyticus]